jgi:flagellar export protein FliJ
VKKAQDTVNDIQTEIAQAMARVDQLQASHERLCKLYDEYRQQEKTAQVPVMGMQASMNQRQFMAQLLNLQQRVVLDLSRAKEHVEVVRKKRSLAEIELHKMKSMEAQDAKAVALDQQRHEQKLMDELGVRQFNLSMQR